MSYVKKILRALGIIRAYHFLWAWFGGVLYLHPSRNLTVVGVTGTKGKTTTIELINAILREAGKKVVLSSSARFQVGGESFKNTTGNTMPGRGFLQKLMRDGVRAGCTYAVIEVVSEGVVQYRHRFIDFDVAVFIGIHPEHIESHGSFEKYLDAKLSFFRYVAKRSSKKNKYFVVNQNDLQAPQFMRAAEGGKIIRYSSYGGPIQLVGDFMRQNAGAAEAVGRVLGIDEETIQRALGNFPGVPGRMEFVQKEPFAVVVDYAHTPDSLEAVYKALKERSGGDLLCVLGSAGGGRDRWKRPKLGEIAAKHCKEIILTDEDPFDEDPQKILDDIKRGIPDGRPAHEILDRKAAIQQAISLAKPGDTVILTGKGSEPYIRVRKGKRIPWSDRDAAREALEKI